jgi:hypothetical protein
MKTRLHSHKPDALFLLALIVGLGMFLSTGVHAAENLFSQDGFRQLVKGDLQLAPVGHHGAVRMTFVSPAQEDHAIYVSQADRSTTDTQGVHLSVKLPW